MSNVVQSLCTNKFVAEEQIDFADFSSVLFPTNISSENVVVSSVPALGQGGWFSQMLSPTGLTVTIGPVDYHLYAQPAVQMVDSLGNKIASSLLDSFFKNVPNKDYATDCFQNELLGLFFDYKSNPNEISKNF
jgi:hypothetical protein